MRHYWRRRLAPEVGQNLAGVVCDAAGTIAMLSPSPRPALSWFSRFIAFLTTPFKRIGIQGWKETGCDGAGNGTAVRDAQHSTDGFWTIDVALTAFSVGSLAADLADRADVADLSAARFLRLEVEPGTAAHEICAAAPIPAGILLSFGGALVIDTDADFLEIHPEDRFHIGGGGRET